MIRALLEYYEHLLSSGLVKEQFGWAETAVPLILDLDRDGKVISLKSAVYIKGVGISGSTVTGLDIITGEIGPICRVHPKIKGIRAASAGAPVCTVNNSSCIHATGREQGVSQTKGY